MIAARFLLDAEVELLKEIAYYSTAREGVGIKFQKSVEAAISAAALNPKGGAPASSDTRSRIVKGFPFSVVYRASDVELLIIAIVHHRRRPNYWSNRAT